MNEKGDEEDAVIILPNVRAQTTLLSFKQAVERFIFEDCDVRTAVLAMREARNIFQLVDASELLEFFYDDESETAILRCLACFKLHLASKPTLSSFDAIPSAANTQLVKHDKQWPTWQWYNFEARNDAFASQRPKPDLVYQISNLEQLPFILRRCYPYFLVAQWKLEISVTAVIILTTSSIAWRKR